MDLSTIGIIIGIIVGVVAIGEVGIRVVKWLRHLPPSPATEETLREIDTKLGRIAEYLDGLHEAAPQIRDPFDEARKLEKEYKYREAINQYEACFQPETTASQRAALHILVGNCFLGLSELEEAEGHYTGRQRQQQTRGMTRKG